MRPPGMVIRLAVMLLIVLPTTILLMAAVSGRGAEDGPLFRRAVSLAVFFSLLGPILGLVLIILHTLAERWTGVRGVASSIALGVVIGGLVVVPLVLDRHRTVGVLYGVFAGGLYASLLALLRRGNPPQAARA